MSSDSKDVAAGRAGIVIVRGDSLSSNTAQTAGMPRAAAITSTIGAQRLWMGRVTALARSSSEKHHHGEAETAAYCLAGHTRVYFGDDYSETLDLYTGDFIYVPPWVPHIETNPEDEDAQFLAVRTPDNIVVNLGNA